MNAELSPLHLTEDPIEGFLRWLGDAEKALVPEPTAMTLATATREGQPSARIVLFKGVSQSSQAKRSGLQFFTNYESVKSRELLENPQASVVFYWPTLKRQIRFEGKVEKLSLAESNAYFQSRPRGSRIGAWSSPQSRIIKDRGELLKLVEKTEAKFSDGEVPCPPFWGGWRLVPERVEFWQEGQYRLHDRFSFEWNETSWKISRLAP